MQAASLLSRGGPVPTANVAVWRTIVYGGVLAGIGDIAQALVVFWPRGASPERILQSIAVGLLGHSAYEGGWKTALTGLILHFAIATIWAAVYYAASRVLRIMVERPVLSGVLYGEIVFLSMYLVVLPLSRVARDPYASLFTVPLIITGWIGHPLLVGLPIALTTRRAPANGRCSRQETWN